MPSNMALIYDPPSNDAISREPKKFDTDVLVIGGGLAGSFAAIEARAQGVRVALADKAWVHRAGSAGCGADHWAFFLNEGGDWDTPEAFNKWMVEVGGRDYNVVNAAITRRLPDVLRRLEALGVEFLRDPVTGKYLRTNSFGRPGPWAMMSNNANIIEPALATKLRRSGVLVLDWTMITSLLKQNGRITGAVGFHIRHGNPCLITTKTVILATGPGARLTANSTGNPYNSWQSPFNTGSGQELALEAGAELVDLELCRATLIVKGFGSPGMNAFTGMGCHFINAKGERFMSKYHKMGEKSPRSTFVTAAMREISEGRGPIYVDARHLAPKDREFLMNNLLTVDKPLLKDYFEAKNIDLAKDPVEIEVSEVVSDAGIFVNENCETNCHGLFAAGSCATVVNVGNAAGPMCIALGISAGEAAARVSKDLQPTQISESDAEDAIRRIYEPFDNESGVGPKEFNLRIVNACAALRTFRHADSLRKAGEELANLESVKITAKDLHDLMRANEAKHLLLVARALITAAAARNESRFFHQRVDYPQEDPAMYDMHIGVRYSDGEFLVRRFPRDLGPFGQKVIAR